MFHSSMVRRDMSLLLCSPVRSVSMPERPSQLQQRSRPSSNRGSEVFLLKSVWLRPEGFSLSGRIMILKFFPSHPRMSLR